MTGDDERIDARAWRKMVLIGVMCMAQTFPYVLVTATIPTIFRAEGLDLKSFTAFSLLTVPAWIKFLWAPLVDAYGHSSFGLRKSWILPCTLGGALSILALMFFPPDATNLKIVIALLLVYMLIMATQDIAVDAYTLENLRPRERGVGSSIKVFFEAVGEAAALGGLMYIYTHAGLVTDMSGWTLALIATAILLMLFTTPVIIRPEPPLSPEIVKRRAAGDRPNVLKFVRRADTPPIALLLFLGGFVNLMLPPLAGPMLIDAGFSLFEVGLILGAVMPIAAPLGAILAGVLMSRFGLRWMLGYLCIAPLVAFAPIVLLLNAGIPSSGTAAFVAELATALFPDWQGGPKVILAGLALILPQMFLAQLHMCFTVSRMWWSSRTQAGTDFTSHGALYNLGRTATMLVSPLLAAMLGWSGFLACVALAALAVAAVYLRLFGHLSDLVGARQRNELEAVVHIDSIVPEQL